MEKKELQKIFNSQMTAYGFKSRAGNYSYLQLEEDYMIGVWLNYSTYGSAYYVQFGVDYEPDLSKTPFKCGWCDWSFRCLFTTEKDQDLSKYPIEDLNFWHGNVLTEAFEYKERTAEEFEKDLHVNFEKRISLIFDRNYILNLYRNHWNLFFALPANRIEKICRLADLEFDEVIRFQRRNRIPFEPTSELGRLMKEQYIDNNPFSRGEANQGTALKGTGDGFVIDDKI